MLRCELWTIRRHERNSRKQISSCKSVCSVLRKLTQYIEQSGSGKDREEIKNFTSIPILQSNKFTIPGTSSLHFRSPTTFSRFSDLNICGHNRPVNLFKISYRELYVSSISDKCASAAVRERVDSGHSGHLS